jgi:F-type H+-transporting ATPase subunit delta
VTGALSVHYARALADAVFKPDSGIDPKDAVAQLQSAEALVSGSSDLQWVLLSPAVNKARKIALFSKFSDRLGLHRTIRNFLSVLIAHRRTHELKAISQSFQAEVDQRLGWVSAQIASAAELSPEEKQELERALGVKVGKFIRAEYTVDASLLGGIRAHVESHEYDATLRGKLESMRQYLHADS